MLSVSKIRAEIKRVKNILILWRNKTMINHYPLYRILSEIFICVISSAFFALLVFTFSDWIDMLCVKPVMQRLLNYDRCWGMLVSVAILAYYTTIVIFKENVFCRQRFVVEITVNIVFLSDFFIVKHWIWPGKFFLLTLCELCMLRELYLLYELYSFVKKTAKAEEKEPRFEIEETNKVTDDYRRDNVVEGLYQFVRNSFYSNQSFATGIAGGWGSGKTTFINKLRTLAQRENIIIVNFDAWRYGSADAIVKNFFNLYRRKTGTRIPRLDSSVDDYVCELLDAQGSGWAKMAAKALQRIAKDEDPYETLKSKLNEAQRKVLVFIDDIDRLDASEILGVLRLVRNSANFPYTHFVLTYDKEYVVNTLKNGGLKDPSAYMEKVINMEFPLPAFEKRRLCEELEKRIKKYHPLAENKNEIHDMVWFDYADSWNMKRACLGKKDKESLPPLPQTILTTEVLKTMRDVIRFRNSFGMTINMFAKNGENEFSLTDLYFLELLRYKYTDIYNSLRNSPRYLLQESPEASVNENPEYVFERSDNYENEGEKKIKAEFSYRLEEANTICKLLRTIFQDRNNSNGIIYLRNYNKYFMFRQDPQRLSQNEFLLLIRSENKEEMTATYNKKNPKEFQYRIGEWLSDINQKMLFEINKDNADRQKEIKKSDANCKNVTSVFKLFSQVEGLNDEAASCVYNHLTRFCYSKSQLESALEIIPYFETEKVFGAAYQDKSISGFLNCLLYKKHYESSISGIHDVVNRFLENVGGDKTLWTEAIVIYLDGFKNGNLEESDLVLSTEELNAIINKRRESN